MRQRRTGLFVLLALGPVLGAAVAADPQSADACGACHRDIYRMWEDSAHARAFEDPFFLEPLGRITRRYGDDRAGECIGCHAPMARLIGDRKMSRAISREGVSCEFCHGLVAVEIGEDGPRHKVDIGPVKRGTIPGADSRGHEVAYSKLHEDSLVCAPCHEYMTRAAVPVMTTYTEWAGSAAAERGETCQSCHMSLVDSNVVDPRIKRDSGAQVNLHQMPGGNSIQQLHRALKVKLRPHRVDDGLEVITTIVNSGAGHAVPTGMPGRQIVLRINVSTSSGGTFSEERTYEKRFVDADGEQIRGVAELFFAKGLSLADDTRIAPDEERKERFLFPMPADASAWIDLELTYRHDPWAREGQGLSRVFISERRFVAPAGES